MDAVRLMTVHGSKGLEFEAVHIPGMTIASFPSPYRGQRCPPPIGMIVGAETLTVSEEAKLAHDHEEECLFFVAMSRAHTHLRFYLSQLQPRGEVQPFVLTTAELPEYDINYLGREKIDEIGCFVFSVKPKKLLPHKRYFEGQVWVDDRDLQIVKSYGKGVGLEKKNADQQFPKFETYREQIDGKYWFPTYTHADDTLHFKNLNQRIRLVVKYQDYKRYVGKATIKYGDVVDTSKPPRKKIARCNAGLRFPAAAVTAA